MTGQPPHKRSRTASATLGAVLAALFVAPPGVARRAHAQESPPARPGEASTPVRGDEFDLAVSDAVQKRIDEAVAALGSPSYTERQAATEALQRIGVSTVRALRDAYHLSDDLEVRLRIEAIVHGVYIDEYLCGRNGFLGISIGDAVTHDEDPRVPRDGVGITIDRVLMKGAASDAGLIQGDIIVAMDREPIRAGMAWFRDTIRERHRGDLIVLSVIRRERVYDFDVVLGGRPIDTFDGDLAPLRAETERRFRIWWGRFFIGFGADADGAVSTSEPDSRE